MLRSCTVEPLEALDGPSSHRQCAEPRILDRRCAAHRARGGTRAVTGQRIGASHRRRLVAARRHAADEPDVRRPARRPLRRRPSRRPATRLDGARRLSRRRLSSAAAASARARQGDGGFHRRHGARRALRRVPDVRTQGIRGRSVPRFLRRLAERRPGEVPRSSGGRWHVRYPRRHPPAPSRHRLYGGGEERRCRRHLVREPLSGLPRGQPQSHLLLLVRSQRLAAALLAPKRAARLLRPHRLRLRHSREHPFSHRSDRGALCGRHLASTRARAAGRGNRHGERDHQRRRPAQSAEAAEHRGRRHLRGPRVPHRAVGGGARPDQPARGGDRHRCQRIPNGAGDRPSGRARHHLPAHTTPGWPRAPNTTTPSRMPNIGC